MRRGISILLALMFGLGPLSSALPGAEDASLPACCRRGGVHHCAMAAHMAAIMAAIESGGKASVSAPTTCPYYPGATIALLMPAYALTSEAQPMPEFEASTRALLSEPSADLQAPSLTYAGRGPPTTS